ncbi:hypothetical protein ACFVZH_05715 [Streptomyces sp. NPDC059534]|uniref:hypothetical protein n=1 Tax=Streptomyces sp. NPDC059534 TaxID=3346859 RepID=UPI003693B22E
MNRRTTAAAALLGLLTLAACGIQKSDVVEAGGAATVAVFPAPGQDRVVLYFLGPDGRPLPAVRDLGGPFSETWPPSDGTGSGTRIESGRHGPVVTDKVLAMLLNGPSGVEAAAGMTTGLPRSGAGAHVEADKAAGVTEGRRLLRLSSPFPVGGLTDEALQQLVCTTAFAEDPAGMVEVALTGPDGSLPAARCEF